MNTTTEKSLNYRCFLLGIIVYWMFEAVWTSFAPFFFNLEGLSWHPVAVVVGKSVLFLLVFYLLFRKPKMFNIKWVHVAIMVGFLVLMHVLDYFLVDRLGDVIREKWVLSDVPDYVMRDVRKWVNLATSFLTIGFLWWRYDSEVTASDIDTSVVESRSYYGGILFSLTFPTEPPSHELGLRPMPISDFQMGRATQGGKEDVQGHTESLQGLSS